MRLRELRIKNFGKFKETSIELEDGINLIYGENESGKSTIYSFVRSMLFGLRKQRGRAAKTDLYARYEPRENAAYYAGMVRFFCGGKLFRLERSFHRETLQEELICETDGERLSVEDGDLRVLLGGASQVLYDNTVSVGQLNIRTGSELTNELQNYMTNYQGTAEQKSNLSAVLNMLKTKKRQIEKRQAEFKRQKEDQRTKWESKEAFARTMLAQKERELQECKEKQEKLRGQCEMIQKENTLRRRAKRRKEHWCCISALLAFSVCVANVLNMVDSATILWKMLMATAAVLTLIVGIWLLFCILHKVEKEEDIQINERSQLEWHQKHLEEEIRDFSIYLENLEEERREFSQSIQPPDYYEQEIRALDLAMKLIADIAISMQKEISEKLKKRLSGIVSELTDGRYEGVMVNDKFEMELLSKEGTLPLYRASSGTVEQVYFALRMTAAELLCKEEELPVILDESFVNFDDLRAAHALKWLHHNKEQVLVFTCQQREEQLLQKMGIPYHKIILS